MVRVFFLGALLKALLVVPFVVAFIDSQIWGLVLVVISSCVTGLWGVLVARMQAHENRQLHERLIRMEQRQVNTAEAVGAEPHPPPSPEPRSDDELHQSST